MWSPGIPQDAPYGGQRNAYNDAGTSINGFWYAVMGKARKGSSLEEARKAPGEEVRENFRQFLADRKGG